MGKKRLTGIAIALLLISTVGIAGATTINFESAPIDLGFPSATLIDVSNTTFSTQEFSFTTHSLAWIHTPSYEIAHYHADNGSNFMQSKYSFTMATLNGDAFSFSGFDGAESLRMTPEQAGFAPDVIQLTGNFSDGSFEIISFSLDKINDSIGPLVDYQTFLINGGWDDLISLNFSTIDSNYRMAIDNIIVNELNPVPEPATMLLFGLGLLGLAGVGRKKIVIK